MWRDSDNAAFKETCDFVSSAWEVTNRLKHRLMREDKLDRARIPAAWFVEYQIELICFALTMAALFFMHVIIIVMPW